MGLPPRLWSRTDRCPFSGSSCQGWQSSRERRAMAVIAGRKTLGRSIAEKIEIGTAEGPSMATGTAKRSARRRRPRPEKRIQERGPRTPRMRRRAEAAGTRRSQGRNQRRLRRSQRRAARQKSRPQHLRSRPRPGATGRGAARRLAGTSGRPTPSIATLAEAAAAAAEATQLAEAAAPAAARARAGAAAPTRCSARAAAAGIAAAIEVLQGVRRLRARAAAVRAAAARPREAAGHSAEGRRVGGKHPLAGADAPTRWYAVDLLTPSGTSLMAMLVGML